MLAAVERLCGNPVMSRNGTKNGHKMESHTSSDCDSLLLACLDIPLKRLRTIAAADVARAGHASVSTLACLVAANKVLSESGCAASLQRTIASWMIHCTAKRKGGVLGLHTTADVFQTWAAKPMAADVHACAVRCALAVLPRLRHEYALAHNDYRGTELSQWDWYEFWEPRLGGALASMVAMHGSRPVTHLLFQGVKCGVESSKQPLEYVPLSEARTAQGWHMQGSRVVPLRLWPLVGATYPVDTLMTVVHHTLLPALLSSGNPHSPSAFRALARGLVSEESWRLVRSAYATLRIIQMEPCQLHARVLLTHSIVQGLLGLQGDWHATGARRSTPQGLTRASKASQSVAPEVTSSERVQQEVQPHSEDARVPDEGDGGDESTVERQRGAWQLAGVQDASELQLPAPLVCRCKSALHLNTTFTVSMMQVRCALPLPVAALLAHFRLPSNLKHRLMAHARHASCLTTVAH
jgi:hypothetical protein